jgi:uncharacterized protein (TIGR00255 family)
MIKSMTGFASLTHETEAVSVGVTLRAVNHRYLDVQVRLPQLVADLEASVRGLVQRRLARGRVEVMVAVNLRTPPTYEVALNEPFVAALASALDRARASGIVAGALTPGDLLRFSQALSIKEQPPENLVQMTDVRTLVESAVGDALEDLDRMRAREGGYLRDDLDGRRVRLAEMFDELLRVADEGRAGLEERLGRRVAEMALEVAGDPAAIAQEIVRLAARSDVSEEVARFRAHLDHWQVLSNAPEPCGRKLDFLLQEMNREVNTVGSKAEGGRVAELVVAIKAELEKLREQVQNVE